MRAHRLLPPGLLFLSACLALTPARSGIMTNYTWTGSTGGASTDSSKWTPLGSPHGADATFFGPSAGYNVAWNSPIDTVASISVSTGRPRFNCNSTLRVGGQVLVVSESLTVLSGTMRCHHLVVGSSNTHGTLLVTGPNSFVSTTSTGGSFFGDGGVATVTVNGGAALTSNGFIDMGFSSTDACTTNVAGRGQFTFINSSINTSNPALGDMIVGDQGYGLLNLFNAGHGDVAGALLIGKNPGGIGDVELFQTGVFLPSLQVHGITNVGWNQSGVVPGSGTLNVARGTATLLGHMNIACGTAFATGGFLHAADGITMFYPSPAGPHAPALTVTSGSAQVDSSFVIGDGTARAAHGANAVAVQVIGPGSLAYTGTRTLLIGNDGLLAATSGGTITSAAEIDVAGTLDLGPGSLQAPLVHAHVQGGYSAQVQTAGTLAARVLLDPNCALVGIAGTSTVGDSNATDGFVSSGTVRVVGDTLTVLDADGAELGGVLLEKPGSTLPVLVLPHGGRSLGGMTGDFGGVIIGSFDNEGASSLTSGTLDIRNGAFQQLNGSLGGFCTLFIHPESKLSARGILGPVVLQGALDFGPTPAGLNLYSISCANTASMRFRLAPRATNQTDTLFASNGCVISGTLDMHAGSAGPPAPGDTLTLIRCPSTMFGTFSNVLWEGQPAAGHIQIIYEAHVAKAVVLDASGVVASPPPTVLRFSAAGSPQHPAFALDLPSAARVEASLYDVGGRSIARLADGAYGAGRHVLTPDWATVPSGVYYARALVAEAENRRVLTVRAVRIR